MIISSPINVTFRGQPANLRVLRNDGCCWGHLTLAEGTELDVEPPYDLYALADEAAIEHLNVELHHEHAPTAPATRRLGLPWVNVAAAAAPAPAAQSTQDQAEAEFQLRVLHADKALVGGNWFVLLDGVLLSGPFMADGKLDLSDPVEVEWHTIDDGAKAVATLAEQMLRTAVALRESNSLELDPLP